jgi:hypothetical protein
MSSNTRSQEKKRREKTIKTKKMSRSVIFANLEQMIKSLNQQFDQMMTQMSYMHDKMNNLSIKLEKMKNSFSFFITTAFVSTTASVSTTAFVSTTTSASTTASVSAAASDSISAMIIQIESIVSAFVVSAFVLIVSAFISIKFIRRDIILLRNQLSEVRSFAALLDLQIKTKHFCKMNDSFKLAIQEEHIEKEYIKLRSVSNKVSTDHN